MPLPAEFNAVLDGDRIIVPADVVVRLAETGTTRLRVRLEAASGDPERLDARGIDSATLEQVASVQRFERDVAVRVLAGEGIARATPLGSRLDAIVTPAADARAAVSATAPGSGDRP